MTDNDTTGVLMARLDRFEERMSSSVRAIELSAARMEERVSALVRDVDDSDARIGVLEPKVVELEKTIAQERAKMAGIATAIATGLSLAGTWLWGKITGGP